MALSKRTEKVVCLASRGRCGAPGCSNPVLKYDSSGAPHILGQIAHIVGRSARGPRGSEDLDAETRDDPDNLILLCTGHHAEVDRMVADYPVKKLREWKRLLLSELNGLTAHAVITPVYPWSMAHCDPLSLVDDPRLTARRPWPEMYAALLELGARDLHLTTLQLEIENLSRSSVTVGRVYAEILRRSASPMRAVLFQPTAGAQLQSVFRIDLEATDTTAYMVVGEDSQTPLRQQATKGRSSIRLRTGESAGLLVEGFTASADVEWNIGLEVIRQGEVERISAGIAGSRIETLGMPNNGPCDRWLLPGIAGERLQRAPLNYGSSRRGFFT